MISASKWTSLWRYKDMVIIIVFLCITLQEASRDIAALNNSVVDLEEKQAKIAEFFCEDTSKFKIEELFVRLWKFADQLPVLAKVNYELLVQCYL